MSSATAICFMKDENKLWPTFLFLSLEKLPINCNEKAKDIKQDSLGTKRVIPMILLLLFYTYLRIAFERFVARFIFKVWG